MSQPLARTAPADELATRLALGATGGAYRGVTVGDVEEILQVSVLGSGGEVERLRMPDIKWE